MEKSPPNVVKVKNIAEYFKERPQEVAFISMTTSNCFKKGGGDKKESLADALDFLHREQYPHLNIKYEDLLRDLYEVSQRIVRFLPSLKQLDPDNNTLNTTFVEGERGHSIVDYVVEKGPFRNQASVSLEQHRVDERLGYES